jgi:hypothetical protein
MMKKGKKNKSINSNQIQLGFDQKVSSHTGPDNTSLVSDSPKEGYSAKIIQLDTKAHLYRSILNRKME